METAVNLSKLFIPVIAFIGIYIASQQYHANRERVRFDLYEKRVKIYDSISQYIDELLWESFGEPNERRIEFETACNEADFLLPDSVCKIVNEIKGEVRTLQNTHRSLGYIEKRGDGDPKAELVKQQIMELESKLEELQPQLKESFKEVLKFEKF